MQPLVTSDRALTVPALTFRLPHYTHSRPFTFSFGLLSTGTSQDVCEISPELRVVVVIASAKASTTIGRVLRRTSILPLPSPLQACRMSSQATAVNTAHARGERLDASSIFTVPIRAASRHQVAITASFRPPPDGLLPPLTYQSIRRYYIQTCITAWRQIFLPGALSGRAAI